MHGMCACAYPNRLFEGIQLTYMCTQQIFQYHNTLVIHDNCYMYILYTINH